MWRPEARRRSRTFASLPLLHSRRLRARLGVLSGSPSFFLPRSLRRRDRASSRMSRQHHVGRLPVEACCVFPGP